MNIFDFLRPKNEYATFADHEFKQRSKFGDEIKFSTERPESL